MNVVSASLLVFHLPYSLASWVMLPLHIYNNMQQVQVLRAWTHSSWPPNAMLVSRPEAGLKVWSHRFGFVASGTVSRPLTWRNCCCCWWWCFLGFLSVLANMSARDMLGQLEIYYAYKSGFLQPQRQFTCRCALALIFQLPVFISVRLPCPVAKPVWNSAAFAERPILHRLYQKRNVWWMTPCGTLMVPSENKL